MGATLVGMTPMDPHTSRYRIAVRRSLTTRRAALAALALVPGVACSTYDDAEVFRSATTIPSTESVDDAAATDITTDAVPDTATSSPTPTDATPVDTEPSTTVAPTDTANAPDTHVSSESSAGAFVSGAELAVSFTFTPTAGGRRIENPFIAVWVEDTAGNLVRTISLWYEVHEESAEWLAHLTQWTAATDATIDTTTSGATRIPGEYTVTWDGVDDDGAVVADGEYVLFVEAARRGGAHDVTSAMLTVGGDGFDVTLPDSGELTALSAELVA